MRDSTFGERIELHLKAIAAIDALEDTDSMHNVRSIMSDWELPVHYYWQFCLAGHEVLEFHNYPQNPRAQEDHQLMDFAVSLIRGIVACPSTRRLQQYAQSIEAFREFVSGLRLPEGVRTFSNHYKPESFELAGCAKKDYLPEKDRQSRSNEERNAA